MATNITEKNKTLHEIIDWCTSLAKELRDAPDGDFCANININIVKADTLTMVIRHCQHMLDQSDTMPDETPNQSEDAK